jgi:hypothetical protein
VKYILLRIKKNKSVNSFYSPKKQKRIQHLQSVKKNMKKKNIRAKQGIQRLKNTLSEVQNQMKNCSDITIQQSLESAGINTNQSNLT